MTELRFEVKRVVRIKDLDQLARIIGYGDGLYDFVLLSNPDYPGYTAYEYEVEPATLLDMLAVAAKHKGADGDDRSPGEDRDPRNP